MNIFLLLLAPAVAFVPCGPPQTRQDTLPSTWPLASAPADSDFAKAIPMVGEGITSNTGMVDPNTYNVPLDQAAKLWTVSVSAENQIGRVANKPFLDCLSKDYYVDDVTVVIQRTESKPGLGMELLELAGGRDDGYGLTVVEAVTAGGNAEAAGVLAGDSIGSIQFEIETKVETSATSVEESVQVETFDCECRDFDSTFDVLTSMPSASEITSITVNLKRIRRWPKLNVVVEYPPSQCAEGVDNTETLELFAGENLQRALLNRRIIMEDPAAAKCDFCGNKCTVKIDQGIPLLSPMSTTEEKIMQRNPKCRISCKAVVGYNMQEGNLRVKVNLNAWTQKDKKESNPFFSK